MLKYTLENGNTFYTGIQDTALAGYAGFKYLEIVNGTGFTELSLEWTGEYTDSVEAHINNNFGEHCNIFDYITVLDIMLLDFGIIDDTEYIDLLHDCITDLGEHLEV